MDERAFLGSCRSGEFSINFYKLADGALEADQFYHGTFQRVYDELTKKEFIDCFGSIFNLENINWDEAPKVRRSHQAHA